MERSRKGARGWALGAGRAQAGAAALAALLLAAGLPAPAAAQGGASTTVRLIELLIQNGVLTRDQAQALLRQAQTEEAAARRAAPPPRAAAPAPVPRAAPAAIDAEPPPPPPGTIRVPFVPESVRRQIRDDVTRDVMAQLKTEGRIPAEGAVPEWIGRIRPYGDLRLRAEWINFPAGNAAGFFPNFFSINNSASGFDLNGTANAPFLNVTEDRSRYRIRARGGLQANLNDWMMMDFRIATGNDSSPVSTNQTFGAVSSSAQQYGFYSRYAVWLDRAYVRSKPADWLTVWTGRMPNPFQSTDLVYDTDLNFDGIAATARHRLFSEDLTGYLTVGAFPYFNTDLNFSSTDVTKTPSRDRWMLGVQGGAEWKFHPEWKAAVNLGYYNFFQAAGALSAPCPVPWAADACNTDISRAFFTQNTNTFFPVRNITPDPSNPAGAAPQYFGLASSFAVLDLYTRLEYAGFNPVVVTFEGNYVNNLAFDRTQILRLGILPNGDVNGIANNLGQGNRFVGGRQGYMFRMTVGHRDVEQPWHWQAHVTYRYLESDAVMDAFTDSDFRLGGTNSKGFILGGALGIARNAALRGRWMSGQEVAGPPYRADIFQFDLLARF